MNSINHGVSFAAKWKHLTARLSRYRAEKTSEISHKDVIADLVKRTELSGSYITSIILANLIALLGLLTNSVAVVIGAMLISPLMGPIFSMGVGFSMSEMVLLRRALRNITYSILLTVFVSALLTLLSPLKGVTHEILARTRPNIYDLLIAVFAGTAGALAICTRKNYLFTTTGVAVATAVIPPLSVVGYGIGTAQAAIALGGFLLFFTNLVAIVISSDIVFHILGFRSSMVEEARYTVRRRVQIQGAVLALISVPLVYTLVTDIRKVKLTNKIERVLKKHLDSKDRSRMTDYSFQKENDGLAVAASVNTVRFYNNSTEKRIENDLKSALKSPVQLDLEQVIVRTGRVEPKLTTPGLPLVESKSPQPESLATLREKTIGRVKAGCEEVLPFIKPYPITQCSIRFSDQTVPITVIMTIARDYPFSDEERRWLRVALEKKLGEPLELDIATAPFLPPMRFDKVGKLDDASRKALAVFKQFTGIEPKPHIVITAPHVVRRGGSSDNRDFEAIKEYLVKDMGIQTTRIIRGPDHGTDFRIRVEPARL